MATFPSSSRISRASRSQQEGEAQESSLGAAIDDMQAGGPTYVRFGSVVEDHPELQAMLDREAVDRLRGNSRLGVGYKFFLGRRDTVTPLHAAFPCNLFAMVHGRKRWTLYPASSSAGLRPTATGGQYYYSEVDPTRVDTVRFPAYPYLDGYRFVLEEGDVLYNPPYVWHYVENLTDTIGVGVRFNHFASAWRASPMLLLLRVLAYDPPPWKTLRALGNSRRLFTPAFEPTRAPTDEAARGG